jgi:hypothetical protein
MLLAAISQDSSIATTKEKFFEHPGNDAKYLDDLGLSEKHLKRLEKMGYAVRAYTKNIWMPGEPTPDNKPVKPGTTARGPGHRVKWLLLRNPV